MTELEKLRRAVEALHASPGWDWNGFVSTLIATLVGAAIASAVTIWVLRRQRRDQYEARMADASRSALDAVLAYGDVRFLEDRDEDVIRTSGNRVVGEVSMLNALSNGADRLITNRLQELANAIVLAPITASPRGPLADLASSFSKLVARRMPMNEQKKLLDAAIDDVASS